MNGCDDLLIIIFHNEINIFHDSTSFNPVFGFRPVKLRVTFSIFIELPWVCVLVEPTSQNRSSSSVEDGSVLEKTSVLPL